MEEAEKAFSMAIDGRVYVGMYMCIKEPTGWFEEWHGIPLVASTGCIEIRANEMLELKLERHSADLGQRVWRGESDGCTCVMQYPYWCIALAAKGCKKDQVSVKE